MRSSPFLSLLPFSLGSLLAIGLCSQIPLFSANAAEEPGDTLVELEPEPAPIAQAPSPRDQWVELFVFGDAETQRWAAGQIVSNDADWPDDYRGEFLHRLAPGALVTAHRHHIPPSVTIAQAVLESGWGRSSLAHTYNNLFGVKAMNGHPSIRLNSAEILNGVRVPMKLSFTVFEDWDHAIEEHGALLAKSRYDRARRHWTDWRTFIELIAPIYASDPRYAARVGIIIENYDLDRWDDLVVSAVDMAATAPDVSISAASPMTADASIIDEGDSLPE